jgi:DNA repair exonuclease SbcCD ATPase subunit
MTMHNSNHNGPPILAPVHRLDDRVAELVAQVREWRAKIDELRAALADMIAEGEGESDEADHLSGQMREIRVQMAEYEGLVAEVERRVDRDKTKLLRGIFLERLQTIKRQLGGHAGEEPRRLERIKAVESELEEAKDKLEAARRVSALLRAEAQAIQDVTNLPLPDLRVLPAPSTPVFSPGFARSDPVSRLQQIAAQLQGLGVETHSVECAAALPDVVTEEEWGRRLQQNNRARIETQAQEREQAREEVDAWLAKLLRDTPVRRDRVVERAKEQGIAIRRHPHGACLAQARLRLGVIPVYRRADEAKASWWALPGFDEDRWEAIDPGGRWAASVVR